MVADERSSSGSAPAGSPTWWYHRWSRGITVLVTLAFLAGTHYPKLTFGEPGDGPDKILHLSAFILMTTLYRVSGLASTIPRAIGIMVGLACFDEITQELPGLHRNFDPVDLLADIAGVFVAVAWLKALGPPRPRYREAIARYERRLAGVRMLLSRLLNWGHVVVAGTFGALVGGTTLAVFGRNPVVGPTTMLVVGALVGSVAALVAAIEAGRRQMDRRIVRDRRCLACLEPVGDDLRCHHCGGRPVSRDEVVAASLEEASGTSTTVRKRGRSRSTVVLPTVAIVVVVSIVAVSLDLLHVFTGFQAGGPARGALQWFGNLPVGDAMAFDAAFLGLIAAGSVAILRSWSDRRAFRDRRMCGVCGYDLRHLESTVDRSICPECGGPRSAAIADEGPSGDDGGTC